MVRWSVGDGVVEAEALDLVATTHDLTTGPGIIEAGAAARQS
jgi:hypothetical protein